MVAHSAPRPEFLGLVELTSVLTILALAMVMGLWRPFLAPLSGSMAIDEDPELTKIEARRIQRRFQLTLAADQKLSHVGVLRRDLGVDGLVCQHDAQLDPTQIGRVNFKVHALDDLGNRGVMEQLDGSGSHCPNRAGCRDRDRRSLIADHGTCGDQPLTEARCALQGRLREPSTRARSLLCLAQDRLEEGCLRPIGLPIPLLTSVTLRGCPIFCAHIGTA